MKPPLPPAHRAAWRAFISAYWRVTARIEAGLTARALPTLAWYDVLYGLYLAPGHHRRMSELADHVLLSRSGLTRLVDKLEQKGLLVRNACPSDGRASHAQLTARGVEALRKMWPTYRDGIAAHFSSRLNANELATLTALLDRLAAEPAEQAGRKES
ncbi:MAG: MarR family transcriptional regulator [Opitutae bacterium]|nr:MarR family transcriptional regulator [Opitutae bacterium]